MSIETIQLPLDVELLPVRRIAAGNLTCLYENGNLRYICLNGEEVLRMIYTAVRDERWATAPYEIVDETIEESERRFVIRYNALYSLNKIEYRAQVEIEGTDNSISFSMQGEALSDFQRNRIGICVLHPIGECAGKIAVITDPNGNKTKAAFPVEISPHQPFLNIQSMQWQTGAEATASLQFEGDVFETEDQRNWTDYSYKTYSTPQALPKPVWVKKGDTIRQKVTVTARQTEGVLATRKIESTTSETKFPFPKIGYERAAHSPHLTTAEIDLLKQIPFDHYRVVLRFANGGWQEELAIALSEARTLNVTIELVILFTKSAETESRNLAESLQGTAHQISSLLLLQEGEMITPPALLQDLKSFFQSLFPNLKIGYGTDGFFAELNPNRPDVDLPFDFVAFSINPQVHATDTRTMIENLASLSGIIKQISSFAKGKDVFVSPITFKYQEEDDSKFDEDLRMYTSFGAMWTLLAIKHLAAASQLTFYQAKGYRGILREDKKPENNPLFQTLKRLKEFDPHWIIDGHDRCSAMFENEKGEHLLFELDGEWR